MSWIAPDSAALREMSARVQELLSNQQQCLDDLRRYFDPKGDYSGGAFELIGREEHDEDEIGCHDILAVTMLSVTLPARLTRDLLLDSELRAQVAEHLRKIRPDVDLWDDAAVAGLDAANELWELIEGRADDLDGGARDAVISKLLAHKRPRLVPISDRVVRDNLPLPSGMEDRWTAYRTILRGDPSIVQTLEALRAQSPDADVASTLRVFDVIVWMRFK